MVGRESSRTRLICKHTWEPEFRPAKAEIYRRFPCTHYKICQIFAGSKPRQNAVSVPTPRNHPLFRTVGHKMPTMLDRKSLDALMNAIVVPTERQKNPFLSPNHFTLKEKGFTMA